MKVRLLFRRWLEDLRRVRSAELTGWLERLFLWLLVLQRVLSISYWLTAPVPNAEGGRSHRDGRVEVYVLLQLALLLGLWRLAGGRFLLPAVAIASYVVWEMFLNLFSITFLGKLREVNEPPSSIERSLLLLLVNASQLMLTFAIVYRYEFGMDPSTSLFWSALVLGTVGFPQESDHMSAAVALQISLDLVFLALFLGSFAGQIGVFKRTESESGSRTGGEPANKQLQRR